MRSQARRTTTALLTAGCLLLVGGGAPETTSSSSSAPDVSAGTGSPRRSADSAALDIAESTPVEDAVYPRVGDPGVDALSYDLDLTWAPRSRTLTGVETLVFRATADAGEFRLDLGRPLEVASVTLDGADVGFEHAGKDLVVTARVAADHRYTLEVRYSGTPRPVAAPTTRSDFSTLGWTITDRGEVWTMQEPFGAYSWYAVNDQPSDKALYSFTISAPARMVGVANGELVSRRTDAGRTLTRWVLDEPASSYLTTIAIGDLEMTRDRSASGVPITYWTPREAPDTIRRLRVTPDALAWLEQRLGPYPYRTLGVLVVDSRSGMETQSMITLGRTGYTTSPEVILHEIVHQWYGDLVTPADWSDLWMSEGMAMYLQGVYSAEQSGESLDSLMDYWASLEPGMRRAAGPPADVDPAAFGERIVYYGPALMWHELRKRIGDDAFWELVRAWPRVHENGNATRGQLVEWLNEQTGEDLTEFYDAWLLGETSPPRR